MANEGFALFSRPPKAGGGRNGADRGNVGTSGKHADEEAPDAVAGSSGRSSGAADLADGAAAAASVAAAATVPTDATFASLGVTPWMCRVCEGLRIRSPTPVQESCIPPALAGRDVWAIAHTGSGKTAAFAIPVLQRLAVDRFGVYALALTPTRELAFQIAEQFRALGAGIGLRDAVVVGGLDGLQQGRELERRPHVVVATPGRLAWLAREDASVMRVFARLRTLIMDEADRLLEDSFADDLEVVLTALPESRQTMLFSATATPAMLELKASLPGAHAYQAYRGLVTASTLKEEYVFCPARVKDAFLLASLQGLGGAPTAAGDETEKDKDGGEVTRRFRKRAKVDVAAGKGGEAGGRGKGGGPRGGDPEPAAPPAPSPSSPSSAIVFVGTVRTCEVLSALFEELGVDSVALHSGRDQRSRTSALDRFRAGLVPVLLATDVAARGLDIPNVDLVINYDLPQLAREYVHRVGRAGRAGRPGVAISLVTQFDIDLVHRIEGLVGHKLEECSRIAERDALLLLSKVLPARKLAQLRVEERLEVRERKGKTSVRDRQARAASFRRERERERAEAEAV